jgi:LacI family transcriptional regulator
VTGDEPARRAVTRADVARYAGVSTAVVSYVVNGGPRPVAAATAARVREAVQLLGYRPNVSARALRRGATQMLGLVVSDSTNPFFAEFGQEIEIAAAARGYALMMVNSHGDGGAERRSVEDLVGRQVDGLLVGSIWGRPDLELRHRLSVPTVWIDASGPVPGYPSLGTASLEGSEHAVRHLVEVHGHESVGLVVGTADRPPADPRERGWQQALRAAGLPDGPIARGAWSREGGLEAGRRLLAARNPPPAVFVGSDLQAVGVLRAAHERGLRIPEDLAVVAFDGTKESAFCWPPLSAIRQPVAEMARTAVATVLDPAAPPSYRRFQPELVLRASCGCQEAAAEFETSATQSGNFNQTSGGHS